MGRFSLEHYYQFNTSTQLLTTNLVADAPLWSEKWHSLPVWDTAYSISLEYKSIYDV